MIFQALLFLSINKNIVTTTLLLLYFICRLTKELKEKEESLLICQQVCKHLQEEVAEKERKEEDLKRRTGRSESELETLKALLSQTEQEVLMLKQER